MEVNFTQFAQVFFLERVQVSVNYVGLGHLTVWRKFNIWCLLLCVVVMVLWSMPMILHVYTVLYIHCIYQPVTSWSLFIVVNLCVFIQLTFINIHIHIIMPTEGPRFYGHL